MGNIILKNISKSYDQKTFSVIDFNLEINEGEFIILVGPSGCGKSTTLRMIAGLEDVSSGEIIIDDTLVNDKLSKDRDLAMVFQNYALYPHMTVYNNIAYPLKLRKFSKSDIDKKVKEAAKVLGIDKYLNRKPASLSGGQKQRVALGRCIVRSPKAFLMDEPLSNLDAKLRVQMRTEITNLQKNLKKTFIYVTHDQVEAMTMGDRIVVMNEGRIQQADTATNLYENPVNQFVAEFIGSPSMNIIPFENGNISLNGSEFELDINQPINLGIRPEKINLIPLENSISFKAVINRIEPLGSENYLHFEINGVPVICRDFLLEPVKSGEVKKFYIVKKDFRIFDKASGDRVYIDY